MKAWTKARVAGDRRTDRSWHGYSGPTLFGEWGGSKQLTTAGMLLHRVNFYLPNLVVTYLITFAEAEVMWSVRLFCHSVCLSVCLCAGLLLISRFHWNLVLWLPYQSEELVNFWCWSASRCRFRSLFRFPYHCWIRDFRRFISSSHTVTGDARQND